LVQEGAIFYWHIGYEKSSGTTQKSSKILFKRMPRWVCNDLQKAEPFKRKLKAFLNQSE